LTTRERQVLDLILQARSNREIARHLGIEERTVKAHVGRLMRKAGADNRIELTMRVLNHPQSSGAFFVDRRRGERRQARASHSSQQSVTNQQDYLLDKGFGGGVQ
jgi:DNA-binding CsgD family transcriptional regulator